MGFTTCKVAAGAAILLGGLLVLNFQGIPASCKKISHVENLSRLAHARPGSFEAFIQQQAHPSSLPPDVLTEGRKVGLKLVRCTRVDLSGDWPVGRMAKITGSGWANADTTLNVGIWPEQPPSLYDLETKEGVKKKFAEQKKQAAASQEEVKSEEAKSEEAKSDEGEAEVSGEGEVEMAEPVESEDDDEEKPDEPAEPGFEEIKQDWSVDDSADKQQASFIASTVSTQYVFDHLYGDEKLASAGSAVQISSLGDDDKAASDDADKKAEKEDDKKAESDDDEKAKKKKREMSEEEQKSRKVLRRLRKQTRGLKTAATRAEVRLTDDHLGAFLEYMDGKKATRKKIKELILETVQKKDLPSQESLKAMTKVLNRAKALKDVTLITNSMDAVKAMMSSLEKRKDSLKAGSAKFANHLLHAKKFRRKDVKKLQEELDQMREKKSDEKAAVSAFSQLEADVALQNVVDDLFNLLKEKAKGVVDSLSAKLSSVFGKLAGAASKELAKLHVEAIHSVTPELSEDEILTVVAAIGGKLPTNELIKKLIESAPVDVKVTMPSDEAIDTLVKLLPLGKAAGSNEDRLKAVPAIKALVAALLPQKDKYLGGGDDAKDAGGDAKASASSSGSDVSEDDQKENIKAQEEWKPIFGFQVQRVKKDEKEVKEEVEEKMKELLPQNEKQESADVVAAKQVVKEEQESEVRVHGPVTCTTFITKKDGNQEEKSKTDAPMISPERGFMVVITRTLDGYEFDLYGWTTQGSMSSWKSVHVDNVAVESIAAPRIIMAEKDASVKSLRYYISKDMDVDPVKCEKVVDHADCAMGEWTNWTPCTTTCGVGELHRARLIVMDAIGNGRCDQALSEAKICNAHVPCSGTYQDCELSQWGEFTPCSVSCGSGTRTRTREVLKQATGKGLPCGKLSNTVPCHNAPCAE